MKQMETNIDRYLTYSSVKSNQNRSYWRRSSKLSSMVQHYRSLHQNDQKFWLNWTARNGKKLKGRKIMKMEYIGYEENIFWMQIAALFCALFMVSLV